MNGYEMMADSYRQLVKQGKIDKETADREIRVYDFLATCDSDDLCRMVDSSAFNDIIRAYVEMAVKTQILTRTAETRWSDSSVGYSMKRRRNRFLRADPKQKSRETPALCRSAVPTVGQRQVCNYFWWLSQNVRQRPSH